MSSLYSSLPPVSYTNSMDMSSLGQYGQAVAPAPDTNTVANQLLKADVSNLASQGSNAGTDWFSTFFGGKNAQSGMQSTGVAMPALSLLGGLASYVQGNAAQDIAKSQLKESQRQFDLNYGTQTKALNTELEDRQRARVASSPTAYESVDSYVARNKL